MTRFTFRKHELQEWSLEELDDPCLRIKHFKDFAKEVFQSYQASGMGAQKVPALGHMTKMLKRLGAVEFAHAEPYEAAHKKFKSDYQKSSYRRRSVMDEIVRGKTYA